MIRKIQTEMNFCQQQTYNYALLLVYTLTMKKGQGTTFYNFIFCHPPLYSEKFSEHFKRFLVKTVETSLGLPLYYVMITST